MAPCGPASQQKKGSRRQAEPAAAVALAAGLYLVWKISEGPCRARIRKPQRGCNTRCCRCSSARRRRLRGWSDKQGGDGHSRTGGRGGGRLLCRTPGLITRLWDGRRCSQGFCGVVAALDGYGKNQTKTVSAAGEIDPQPVQPSLVAMKAETRPANFPGKAERSPILIRGSCVRKS